MVSPVVMSDLKLPWNSNADMLSVMEDDAKRKKLVIHISKQGFKDGKAPADFMDHVYSIQMRRCIHTIE